MSMTYDQKTILETETTGSVVEAAGGIAVIVLAIIGLSRGDTGLFMSIAGIVLGAALLAHGGTIAAEYSKLLAMTTGGTLGTIELGGGMTVEVLAGGAAMVLGILGLLHFAPVVLLASTVIAVGGSLIFAAGGIQRLNTLKTQAAGLSEIAQRVAQSAVSGAIAAQVLAGAAAIVLGILGLTTTSYPNALTLIGLLVLGAAIAASGAALSGRLLRFFSSGNQ